MRFANGQTANTRQILHSEASNNLGGVLLQMFAESEEAVLEFLSQRPIQTVAMAGFIRDNGMVSRHNRGTFYGYWNSKQELEGVALIGHATLFEARSVAAVKAFATLAKKWNDIHLIMAEQSSVREFLHYYSDGGQSVRHSHQQILFETGRSPRQHGEVHYLRRATVNDLHLILPVHAEMCRAESGVDPLASDSSGFRRRYARRLKQNRTYVWVEGGELKFKADVISHTPEATYLEGIWINPNISGTGKALLCLSHVVGRLLNRSQSICLLTNVTNGNAVRLYEKAGFSSQGIFESVFLAPRANALN